MASPGGLRPYVDRLEKEIQFVWKQLIDPCDAPITIWVQAFWPAFLHLLLAWYELSPIQVIYAYVKPAMRVWRLRGYRHWGGGSRGRRGPKKGKFPNPITMDPSEELGKAIGGWQPYGGYELIPGEVYFWSAIEFIERALFWWQIIDLSKTFLYSWMSGIAQSKYCHARDDAVLLAGAIGYPLIGIFDWDAVGLLLSIKERNMTFFNGFGCMQMVGPGVVNFHCEAICTGPGSGPTWVAGRMRCLNGPRTGVYGERQVFVPEGSSTEIGGSMDCNTGEIWIAEIKVNGGFFIDSPRLYMQGVAPPPQID